MPNEIRLSVEGMHCAGCENNLRFALTSHAGVERAKADYKAKTVEVALDPGVTSEAEIREVIEQIGYTVVAGGRS